jgi:hypothetical protein
VVSKIYLDTETCGLYGLPVLLQYAVDDGPTILVDLWLQPIGRTLRLIEKFCAHTVVGFNLAFDWFQLAKLYTVFRLFPEDWIPVEHIDEIARREAEGRDGPCIKPQSAMDLMLHSRKGPYQALMDRDPVRIRRVPTKLAYDLRDRLEQWAQQEISGIYFAGIKGADKSRVKVFDRRSKSGALDSQTKDVVIAFRPAGGLKPLAEHVLNEKPRFVYSDVEPPKEWYPFELGFAPFATAVSDPNRGWIAKEELIGYSISKKTGKRTLKKKKKGTHAWPAVIKKFIEHWASNEQARQYASDDIYYTRRLDAHWNPQPGDHDSVLACMVATVRWHGFAIDIPAIEQLRQIALEAAADCPINFNSTTQVREYLLQFLDPIELVVPGLAKLYETTDKKVLQRIVNLEPLAEDEPCVKCDGRGCVRCDHGVLRKGKHPASIAAARIRDARFAKKEVENYDKLLLAGRFHASFVVIGTKSSRMSGADGLNAQGIRKKDEVRQCFPLKWGGMLLSVAATSTRLK